MPSAIIATITRDAHCEACWDFNEGLLSFGRARVELEPMGKEPERIGEGMLSAGSRRFSGEGWLRIPRSRLQTLNIHGSGGQVSVLAWMRLSGSDPYQAIAGVWNETRRKRQYCLFFNLISRYESRNNLHGHISHVGGPTPGHEYCVTYATGAAMLPLNQWLFVAMTYDSKAIRVYVNGQLDENQRADPFSTTGNTLNPYRYPGAIFDGGPDGADFTVGAVDRAGEMGNWFRGDLNVLSVFSRALSSGEIADLHGSTH